MAIAAMSGGAVFTNIFRLNTVGSMTQELKSLFLVQWRDHSTCLSCNNNSVVNKATSFVVYITSPNLLQTKFENCICAVMLRNSRDSKRLTVIFVKRTVEIHQRYNVVLHFQHF